mmetsp:Transcript_222/g.602  ORF Transcript_222/g.602 Transcript_222/m.602 type:complete len:245 (+) Transcript_222:289-1023(+)
MRTPTRRCRRSRPSLRAPSSASGGRTSSGRPGPANPTSSSSARRAEPRSVQGAGCKGRGAWASSILPLGATRLGRCTSCSAPGCTHEWPGSKRHLVVVAARVSKRARRARRGACGRHFLSRPCLAASACGLPVSSCPASSSSQSCWVRPLRNTLGSRTVGMRTVDTATAVAEVTRRSWRLLPPPECHPQFRRRRGRVLSPAGRVAMPMLRTAATTTTTMSVGARARTPHVPLRCEMLRGARVLR